MELKIHNAVEEMVEGKMEEIMKQMGCCTCDLCRADVAAYALNHIEPKYVSTAKGELFAKSIQFDKAFELNLMVLITTAAKRVMDHPHHEPIEKNG